MFDLSARGRIRRWLAGCVIFTALSIAVVGSTPALAQVATLGSPPPEAEASSTPTEEIGEQEAMLAYAQCMRDNGVEVIDPVFDASGNPVGGLEFGTGNKAATKDTKDHSFQVATEACDDYVVAFKPALDRSGVRLYASGLRS